MKGRILVVFSDYWISEGKLRRSNKKICLTILQDFSRIRLSAEKKNEQGAGKIFYAPTQVGDLIKSVLKPTQVDWASSLR